MEDHQVVLELFMRKSLSEERIGASHISLFTALVYCSGFAGFDLSFQICGKRVRALAKFGSKATYHRKLRELVEFGLISYQPSYHPVIGSRVSFLAISSRL